MRDRDWMLDAGYWMLDFQCHPAGIFAVVGAAESNTCKDPYRMTVKIRQNFKNFVPSLCASWFKWTLDDMFHCI